LIRIDKPGRVRSVNWKDLSPDGGKSKMSEEKRIDSKTSPAEDLTKTSKAGAPQLKQEELNEVSGGGGVIHDPFTITKKEDTSSPKLYE
jgi:type VI protein secretion system component Hcp